MTTICGQKNPILAHSQPLSQKANSKFRLEVQKALCEDQLAEGEKSGSDILSQDFARVRGAHIGARCGARPVKDAGLGAFTLRSSRSF
jgi:hypothetical protein